MGPPRQRSVLAALLIDPERPVSLNTLVGRVWDESPPAGVRSVVYTYITRLRREIAKAGDADSDQVSLSKVASGYRLSVLPNQVDLCRFQSLLTASRAASCTDQERSRLLRQAFTLWRGEALAGLHSDWAVRVRETLEQVRCDALVEWADAELRLGNPGPVIPELRSALLTASLVEPLHERLIAALYLDGRGVEAVEHYNLTRKLFAEELGADPSAPMRQLYTDILAGGPLELVRRPGSDADVTAAVVTTKSQSATVATSTQAMPQADARRRPQFPVRPGVPAPRRMPTSQCQPQLLPLDLPDFVGRRAELAQIKAGLVPSDGQPSGFFRAQAIVGGAGVGKTALAVHVAHGLDEQFPDGRLYVRLRDADGAAVDPMLVLRRFLRALGEPRVARTEGIDGLADVYRSRLAGRRVLVVLDDAVDDAQIQPLLPGASGCAVLVTSRSRLHTPAGAGTVSLAELPYTDAVTLVGSVIGAERVEREHGPVTELVRLCGALPLALRAAAIRLTAHPHWTVARFVDRVRDQARLFDELSQGTLDVRASLSSSYDTLPDEARELFSSLAMLPSEEFEASVGCNLLDADFATAEQALEQLVDAHLLRAYYLAEKGRIRYRLFGLPRAYAQTLLQARDCPEIPVEHAALAR
jgi:DNA-binding SARP family transcriptional activator